jgi:hypothetical protein
MDETALPASVRGPVERLVDMFGTSRKGKSRSGERLVDGGSAASCFYGSGRQQAGEGCEMGKR